MKSTHLGQMFRVVCLATSVGMMGLLQACASAPPEENPVSISAPVGMGVQPRSVSLTTPDDPVCQAFVGQLEEVGTPLWLRVQCRLGNPRDAAQALLDNLDEELAACLKSYPNANLNGLLQSAGARIQWVLTVYNPCDAKLQPDAPPAHELW